MSDHPDNKVDSSTATMEDSEAQRQSELPITTLITRLRADYPDAAAITVETLSLATDPRELIITVYTNSADSYEDWLSLDADNASIEIDDGETNSETELSLPVSAFATYDGPSLNNDLGRTPVYVSDGFYNLPGEVSPELGCQYLKAKMGEASEWEDLRVNAGVEGTLQWRDGEESTATAAQNTVDDS